MITPPKGLSIGTDAAGNYKILYAGPDYNGALDSLERHPKELIRIFLWRGGVLTKTFETPTSRVAREAHLNAAIKSSNEAFKKAKAANEKKASEAESSKKKASDEIAAKMKSEAEKRDSDRKKRDAELLAYAAKSAAELASATEKVSTSKSK